MFRLLADGYSQSQVSKALKVSRQTVSEHTKRLVRDGHLRKIRGTSRPALYRRTSNPLPDADIGDISLRSHHTSRLFKEVSPPTRPWPWLWDKSWNPSGSCAFYLVRDLLMDTREGPIKLKALRYIEGRSLTIWLDEDHIYTSDQRAAHDDISTEKALLVAQEVQTMTGLGLALPEVMQPSHYVMNAPPAVWLDHSHGENHLETDEPSVADLWLNLQDVIRDLQADVTTLKENQVMLVDLVKDLKGTKGLPPPPDGYEVSYL